MKGVATTALLILLAGCGEDHPSLESSSSSSAGGMDASGKSQKLSFDTSGAGSAISSSSNQDPWTAIPAALATVSDGSIAEPIRKSLETRSTERMADDSKIRRSMMETVSQLATTCSPNAVSPAFAAFQATEAESLAADRIVLREALTTAGAEGRALVWESVAPSGIFTTSRKRMAKDLTYALPSAAMGESVGDGALESRRILLGLKFAVEGVELDTDAALTQFSVDVQEMDPASDETPAAVEAGLAKVDAALAERGQRAVHQKQL